jgi:hypothetical protein
MVSRWKDSRFQSPLLHSKTESSNPQLMNKIWTPRLTFVNGKERPNPFDAKLVVCNTGQVQSTHFLMQNSC